MKILKKKTELKSKKSSKLKQKTPKKKEEKLMTKEEELSDNFAEEDSDDDGDVEQNDEIEIETSTQHKHDLAKIREADPEFYKFLQEQEADLLEFNESDEEIEPPADSKENDEDIDTTSKKPKISIDKSTGRKVFDRNWLTYLENGFAKDKIRSSFAKLAVEAFAACVARTGADITAPQWVINDDKIFDAVVRICFTQLGSTIYDLLEEQENPEKATDAASKKQLSDGKIRFKHWRRYSKLAKDFLTSLLRFLNEIQSQEVILATLKAIAPLVDLYAQFSKLNRMLIKSLSRIWTRKTMDCRVIAYLVLSKIVKRDRDVFAFVYKMMYLGFVSNARHVSSETWPLLQFMQRSFAEITIICPDVAYQYAFTYIRQIAIHLRNAQIGKKRKDLVQTVYNWQLLQCLYLWSRVISKTGGVIGAEAIGELSYPLTQVVIASLKLFPSLRFLPLRFHCLSILIQLQVNCEVYIPTLSLACELLPDLLILTAKKPKFGKGTLNQVDMDSQIRASTQQLEEAGWRQSAGDTLFRILLQAAHILATNPAFPDVILPITHKIRSFCKECRDREFVRLFRSLLEKLVAHSTWILDRLNALNLDLKEKTTLLNAQLALTDARSPIVQYHAQFTRVWKMHAAALQRNDSTAAKQKELKTKKEKVEKVTEEKVERNSGQNEDYSTTATVHPTVKKLKKKVSQKGKNTKSFATSTDQITDLNEMEWSD